MLRLGAIIMKMFGDGVHQFFIFICSLITISFIVFFVSSMAQAKDYKITKVKIGSLIIKPIFFCIFFSMKQKYGLK